MIRDTLLRQINDTLDKHERFESSDFKILNESVYDGTNLRITYNPEPKYHIIILIPKATANDGSSAHYEFTGNVCPGPLAYTEEFTFKYQADIFKQISKWLGCIWEELSMSPIVKQIDNQQQQLDEIFSKFEDIPNEYFTVDESLDLKNRLDELEKTLLNHIENSGKDKAKLEEEVSKLHLDIDTLKHTIDSFNKQGWFRSFASKIFKWTSKADNRQVIGDSYKFLKEFLPKDLKDSMP